MNEEFHRHVRYRKRVEVSNRTYFRMGMEACRGLKNWRNFEWKLREKLEFESINMVFRKKNGFLLLESGVPLTRFIEIWSENASKARLTEFQIC